MKRILFLFLILTVTTGQSMNIFDRTHTIDSPGEVIYSTAQDNLNYCSLHSTVITTTGPSSRMDKTFSTAIAEAASENLMIFFTATWCQPCVEMKPEVEKIAKNNKHILTLEVADIDENSERVKEFNIRQFPTVIYIRSDGATNMHGFATAEVMQEIIDEFLGEYERTKRNDELSSSDEITIS